MTLIDQTADAGTATDGAYGVFNLADIRISKTNRKRFSKEKLQSLREFVKMMIVADNNYALPDDLLADVYSFNAGDEGACAYIDQASVEDVQMILVDLVVGECLGVNSWNVDSIADDESDQFRTVLKMAELEGIDPDQLRADLDKPAEPEVDATPFKRPLITLKKKPADAVEWPFPIPNSEKAGAA